MANDENDMDRGPLKENGNPADIGEHLAAMRHYIGERVPNSFVERNNIDTSKDQSLSGTFTGRGGLGPKPVQPAPQKATITIGYRKNQVRIDFSIKVSDLILSAKEAHELAERIRQHAVLAEAYEISKMIDRSKLRGSNT